MAQSLLATHVCNNYLTQMIMITVMMIRMDAAATPKPTGKPGKVRKKLKKKLYIINHK